MFSIRGACAAAALCAGIWSAAVEGAESQPVIGKFRNTYYYVVPESEFAAELPLDAEIRDMSDRVIARVPAAFRRAMDIEGSGRLRDGRVVNFEGVKDKEIRYTETIHPDGRGVGDCPLIPFHTIAVDRSRIPLGTVVRIRETVGMKLPDGSVHDGLWRAEDVGGAIQKDRIDLFVGDGAKGGDVLLRQGITHLQPLTVVRISDPESESCIQQTPR